MTAEKTGGTVLQQGYRHLPCPMRSPSQRQVAPAVPHSHVPTVLGLGGDPDVQVGPSPCPPAARAEASGTCQGVSENTRLQRGNSGYFTPIPKESCRGTQPLLNTIWEVTQQQQN